MPGGKKKEPQQAVSFLSGTFPPVHLFSAQSLSTFTASPCLTLEAAGCQDDFHSPSALAQQQEPELQLPAERTGSRALTEQQGANPLSLLFSG